MRNYNLDLINEVLQDFKVYLWDEYDRMQARRTTRFKETNKIWYDANLSKRSKIGGVMKLLEEAEPHTKEDWINFYFNDGDRACVLKQYTNKNKHYTIDVKHGKTLKELVDIAKTFQQRLADYTLTECFNYAFIHVIDEPYLGYERELKSERLLSDFCADNGLLLIKTNNYKDIVVGVDYEIKTLSDTLICGIQVKGINFKLANSDLITQNTHALTQKHKDYKESTGVDVLFMYMDNENNLANSTLFNDIRVLSKCSSGHRTIPTRKVSQVDKFNKKYGLAS